jgi:hypothetical protein
MSNLKVLCHLLILVAISAVPGIAAPQNLRDLAREQAIRNPGVPISQPAPPGNYSPKDIEELAREADVVVLATLTRINSRLSSAEDRVLTDYSITGPNFIAGRLPSLSAKAPGVISPLILTVLGGEVIVEGVPIRGFDQHREEIKDGGQYLLFLKNSRQEAGRYVVYYGGIFEVSQDKLKPLLKEAERVFKGTAEARVDGLISRIRAAVQ